MTGQLDANAAARVMERDNAMTEDIQQTMADSISALFYRTLEQLIAIRDSAYANATEALDSELEALAKKHAQLQTAIHNIEATLPAKARLTQHEADQLLLSGKPDARQDAKAKMDELKELQRKPVLLRQQQKECIARSEAIASEKEAIARAVFEDWLKVVRPIVGAGESGLFATLLNGLEQSFYEFQARVGMTRSDNRHRPLLHQGYVTGLTADGRSAEWAAGHKWYG